jgi:inorganic triphosphatase YgiF
MERRMEIEAKFRVDNEATFRDVLGLGSIGPFGLVAARDAEDQRNTYFDTADRKLRADRYGLRVRDIGHRRIATLKGEATVRDGMYEREEWEVDVGPDDRPETWPPGEVRKRVLALTGGVELRPTLAIHTLRRHVFAERGGDRFAELSLDESAISAGGREERFRELEIELLHDGARADFEALVALLRERFALIPEDRSKLARGLALLDATTGSTNI